MGGTWQEPGWTKVRKSTVYNPAAGQHFGWKASGRPDGDQDWTGVFGYLDDHRYWNACIFDAQPRVFSVDVPDDPYEVRLYLVCAYDQGSRRPTRITANDQTLFDGVPAQKTIYTGKVHVDHGRLDLRFERTKAPGDVHWTVCGINLRPLNK